MSRTSAADSPHLVGRGLGSTPPVQTAPSSEPTPAQLAAVGDRVSSRRRLRTTREGKAFILVTLGVGLAAFNTGNNLLFLILGFMLSLIVLSGIMSETVLQGVRISRRLPLRCHAGTTALVEIALYNGKRRAPSYSLEVEDRAQGLVTERRCYFLKVAPQTEQVAAYRRKPERRGIIQLTDFRIATRYPFGIFEKWRNVPAPAELLVYPALLSEADDELTPPEHGAEVPRQQVGRGIDIAGLRAFQEGDEARSIHWKRSAALGRLVVTERQDESSPKLCILLDNARPLEASGDWDAAFERTVSRAATAAVRAAERGQAVELYVRSGRVCCLAAGRAADPLLRFLALLAPEPADQAGPFAAVDQGASTLRLVVTTGAEAS